MQYCTQAQNKLSLSHVEKSRKHKQQHGSRQNRDPVIWLVLITSLVNKAPMKFLNRVQVSSSWTQKPWRRLETLFHLAAFLPRLTSLAAVLESRRESARICSALSNWKSGRTIGHNPRGNAHSAKRETPIVCICEDQPSSLPSASGYYF